MNARLDFDANLNFTRTLNPAYQVREEDAVAILIHDRDPWNRFDAVVDAVVQARGDLALTDVEALATHYKRSLAQRARWMLAEHMKETNHVSR